MEASRIMDIIQLCRKTKSKRLDLGQCGLMQVPADVWKMDWLEELILGNNPAEISNYDLFKADPEVYVTLFPENAVAGPDFNNPDYSSEAAALRFTKNDFKSNHFAKEDFSGIRNLKKLRYLNLNRCGIKTIDFLLNLERIDILLIGGNPGIRFSSRGLKAGKIQVRVLDIFGCSDKGSDVLLKQMGDFIDPEAVQILDVSYNRDATTSFNTTGYIGDKTAGFYSHYLSQFNNLIALDISFTQNPDIERILLGNEQLKYLRAEDCFLHDAPFELLLTRLAYLNISANRIENLRMGSSIEAPYLKELWLESNLISDISFVHNFTSLQKLFLSRNKISSLYGMEQLEKLQAFSCENNNIQDLAPLSRLTSLRTLLASGNKISDLSSLKDLRSLEVLSLSENKLSDAKQLESLISGLQQLRVLHLFKNPYPDIPTETLGKNRQSNCLQEIREHFSHMHKGARVNKEIKLILVGNSTAGKTTLRKLLQNKAYQAKEDSTHGIVMESWTLKDPLLEEPGDQQELQVQIWDFGGQEYYHETHKLFFSDNAVYIVVWEEKTNKHQVNLTEVFETNPDGKQIIARKYIEHHPCEYWLKNIRHYAPDSPVLVVQNKIDLYLEPQPKEKQQADQQMLRPVRVKRLDDAILDKYGVFQSFDLSLKKYAEQDQDYLFDYHKFKRKLIQVLGKTVHEFKLGQSYYNIKKEIQLRKEENVWDYQQYLDVCLRIDPEIGTGIQQLTKYLTSTSVILHFPEHPELKEKVFINPVWISDTIYKILDNKVLERSGEFQQSHLMSMFDQESLALDFIALMKKFELIFQMTGAGQGKWKTTPIQAEADKSGQEKEIRFVAPQYLPEGAPTRSYSIYKRLCCDPKLIVRFPEFLPKTFMNGILSRFASSAIDKSYYRYGVAFETVWMADPEDENNNTDNENINIIECDFELSQVNIYSKSNNPYNLREIFEAILTVYTGFRSTVIINVGSLTLVTTIMEVVARNNFPVHISIDGRNFVSWNELHERWYKTNPDALPLTDDTVIMPVEGDPVMAGLFKAFYMNKGEVETMSRDRAVSLQPPKLFISYSHKDETYKDELLEHLSGMRRNGEIKDWTDRAIVPGEKWDDVIKKKLEEADIILFLLSSSFVASDYIQNIEIKRSIERYNQGKAVIVPIPVRPFDYISLPLKDIQSASKDFKPISTAFPSPDAGWTQVVTNLRLTIENWKRGRSSQPQPG